jgi:hypothetical protein
MKIHKSLAAFAVHWFLANPASAQDANWHLLTQSYGGTVSILHGLTHDACEFARKRLRGLPATPEEEAADKAANDRMLDGAKKACAEADDGWQSTSPISGVYCEKHSPVSWSWSGGGGGSVISPGDNKSAECFQ